MADRSFEINVKIDGNSVSFTNELEIAKGAVKQFRQEVTDMNKALVGASGAAQSARSGLGDLAKSAGATAKAIGSIASVARRARENLRELGTSAGATGRSVESLGNHVRKARDEIASTVPTVRQLRGATGDLAAAQGELAAATRQATAQITDQIGAANRADASLRGLSSANESLRHSEEGAAAAAEAEARAIDSVGDSATKTAAKLEAMKAAERGAARSELASGLRENTIGGNSILYHRSRIGRRLPFGIGGAFAGGLLPHLGVGPERFLTVPAAVAGSAAGAIAGGGFLAAGSLGAAGVGGGSDAAVMKSTISDTKQILTLQQNLDKARQTFGAHSRQAVQAQKELNFAMKDLGPAAQVEAKLAEHVANLDKAFDKATVGARKQAVGILDQVVKLGQDYVPRVAQAAQRNLGIINQGLKPLFAWLEGPQGVGIFNTLENNFARKLPTAIHAFTQGVELLLRVMGIASGKTGGLITEIDKLLTRWNAMSNSQLDAVIQKYVDKFHMWSTLIKFVGMDLAALFRAGAGEGDGLVKTMTRWLEKFHQWETSVKGAAWLKEFFQQRKNELEAMLEVLPPLAKAFGALFMAIQVAVPFVTLLFKGLALVLNTLLQLSKHNDLIKYAIVAPLGAAALAARIFMGSWLKIPQVIMAVARAFGFLKAAETGVAGATAAETTLMGGLIEKLRVAGKAAGFLKSLAAGSAALAVAVGVGNAVAGHGGGGGPLGMEAQGLSAATAGVIKPGTIRSGLDKAVKSMTGIGDYGREIAQKMSKGFGGELNNRFHQDIAEALNRSVGKDSAGALEAGRKVAAQLQKGWNQFKLLDEPTMFKQFKAQLKGMPAAAQAGAIQSTYQFMKTLESQGKLARGSADQFLAQVKQAFPGFEKYLGLTANAGAKAFNAGLNLQHARDRLKNSLNGMRGDLNIIPDTMDHVKGTTEQKAAAVARALRHEMLTNGSAKIRKQAAIDLAILLQNMNVETKAMAGVVAANFGDIGNTLSRFGRQIGGVIGGLTSAIGKLLGVLAPAVSTVKQAVSQGTFTAGNITKAMTAVQNFAGPHRAAGGFVPGDPHRDGTLAALAGNEFIVTGGGQQMMEQHSPGLLGYLAKHQPRHFAAGGFVGFAAGGHAASGAPQKKITPPLMETAQPIRQNQMMLDRMNRAWLVHTQMKKAEQTRSTNEIATLLSPEGGARRIVQGVDRTAQQIHAQYRTMRTNVKQISQQMQTDVVNLTDQTRTRVRASLDVMSNNARTQYRAMQTTSAQSLTRMSQDATTHGAEIDRNLSRAFQAAESSEKGSYNAMDAASVKILTAVVGDTNKALKSLGVKPVAFSVSATKAATGGYIGRPGEKGRDDVPVMVGRGEAVLNHSHQRIVNAALAAQGVAGLPELFAKVTTPHSFAKGGYVDGHGLQHFAGGGVAAGGVKFSGRASTFGPPGEPAGPTASGNAGGDAVPGLSLRIPGTSFGDSRNRALMGHKFRLDLTGHTGVFPDIDLGPNESTGRVIDVTGTAAAAMGLGNFPTDSIGTVTELDAGAVTTVGGGAAASVPIPTIKGPKLSGPKGSLLSMLQSAEKKVVDAANKYVRAHAPQAGPGGAPGPAPMTGQAAVDAMIREASSIASHNYHYNWGGGHSVIGQPTGGNSPPGYDCSGAVSAVLHAAGLLNSPLVASDFMSWGADGPGKWVNIFASGGHTFMQLAGHYFGTSGMNPGGGANWIPSFPGQIGTQRHPNGLAAGGFAAAGLAPRTARGATTTQKRQPKLNTTPHKNKLKHLKAVKAIKGIPGLVDPFNYKPSDHAIDTNLLDFAGGLPIGRYHNGLRWKKYPGGNAAALDKANNQYTLLQGMLGLLDDQDSAGNFMKNSKYAYGADRFYPGDPSNTPGYTAQWKLDQEIAAQMMLLKMMSGEDSEDGRELHRLGRYAKSTKHTLSGIVNRATKENAEVKSLTRSQQHLKFNRSQKDFAAERHKVHQKFTKERYQLLINNIGKGVNMNVAYSRARSILEDEKRWEIAGVDPNLDRSFRNPEIAAIQNLYSDRLAQLAAAKARAGGSNRVSLVKGREFLSLAEQNALFLISEQEHAFSKKLGNVSWLLWQAKTGLTEDKRQAKLVMTDLLAAEPGSIQAKLRKKLHNLGLDQASLPSTGGTSIRASILDRMKTLEDPSSGIPYLRLVGIPTLEKQRNQIAGSAGATGSANSDLLLSLYQQAAQYSAANLATSQAQLSALSGFTPVMGRMVGSFAKGGVIPETGVALVHRDERIISDPQGPYGSQPTTAQQQGGDTIIELHLNGTVAAIQPFVEHIVERHAGRIVSREGGRRVRILSGAPGRY